MSLDTLFSPRSIAVIGASTNPESVGYSLTENLLKNGYTGKVYPVNPKTSVLLGLPCIPDITAVSAAIDVAIIIIPAAGVPEVLRQCGEKRIPAAVIISSGFRETGMPGTSLEDEIISIAHEYGISLLGPNCLGFLRPALGLNASFSKRMPAPGTIAFFSQSGALCTALIDLAADDLGFSYFISTGNKAVIGENELLGFFAQDEETKLIGLYAEGLRDAKKCIEIGRGLIARVDSKPVIALKSGATLAGTEASSSHTGSLAGNDAAYDALFRQARITRAENLEHLMDLLSVFSKNPLPAGDRLGIITNAGGLGVLATDNAILAGLTLAELSPETQKALSILPPAASRHNPVDILGDALADRYGVAIRALVADPMVDMILIIVTPQTMTEAVQTAEAIIDAKKSCAKPIAAVFSGKDSLEDGIALLKKNDVPVFSYPEAGARGLAALSQVARWRKELIRTPFAFADIDKDRVKRILTAVKEAGRTSLFEQEASDVLGAYGFPVPQSHLVNDRESALAITRTFETPLVMKIVSPDIIHKSESGGVLLSIAPEDGAEAYEKLITQVRERRPDARIEGVLIAPMAPKQGGYEIILGLKKEPGLGTIILAGFGGIFVETIRDVAMRFVPLVEEDAKEMLSCLKSFPILQGTRGQAGVHLETIIAMIGRLAQLAEDFPEIAELDINPLLVFADPKDFRVLDARLRLEK